MKINIEDIKRIIKEELAASEEQKGAAKDEKKQDSKFPKITDANAIAAGKASSKNTQLQKSTQKAAEKGGATLVQNILSTVSGYLEKGSTKEDMVYALTQVINKIKQMK